MAIVKNPAIKRKRPAEEALAHWVEQNPLAPDEAFLGGLNPNVIEMPKYVIGDDGKWQLFEKSVKKMSVKEEEESNYIRIDLDEAAKKIAECFVIDEDSDAFLEVYDKYYDILFKCKV